MLRLTKVAVVGVAVLGFLAVPAARANLYLTTDSANFVRNFSGSGLGDLICSFDQNGNRQGDLSSSYNCSYSHQSYYNYYSYHNYYNYYHNYNDANINYCSGNYASKGTCLVAKDKYGNAYVWNICNWNGKDNINCYIKNRYFDCYDIQVYGNCQPPAPYNPPPVCSVPEPTTVIAGALMLLPLGIQGIRQIRRRKQLA